jgi:hypothetical protein
VYLVLRLLVRWPRVATHDKQPGENVKHNRGSNALALHQTSAIPIQQ